MFSGDTDAFDVFNDSATQDFSEYGTAENTDDASANTFRPSKRRNQTGQDGNDDNSSHGQQQQQQRTFSGSSSISNTGRVDEDQEMADLNESEEDDIGPKEKRPRYDSPMPMVTDTFEQDLEREIASSAGLMPSTESANVVLSHQVRHQVALPPNWDYTPITQHVPEDPPVRTYPFTLDPFQKLATYSIERGESVLVSAHTSAGKTVVAEFAIATALRDKQRVIYTSPIKALSNQKYRELLEEFGDVGLMTGDVTINPSASCLVMTTEILRAMLYRGSEIMREMAWVIFDEIHYMRDAERGVVWEETIIMLPPKCHYVFLSATIPNAMEFAEWICKSKQQPCHVVYTNYRPTPLQHYLFPAGGEGIHLVVDEKGQFREDNFSKALGALTDTTEKNRILAIGKKGQKGAGKKDKSTDGPTDIYKIIRMILVKNYHPVIVFSFSKRECEAFALQMAKLDFNDEKEADMVDQVFQNAISGLSEEDQQLPQIEHIKPLLRRGIGIHHGGLLPILKEVIEILFQEGLIKVLFATETFSIGLNMPAKTVVFTSVRKFDGTERRWLSGGEYIQMSGRAGRRGLDDRGVVIMMLDEKMDPAVAKGMVLGMTDPLNSAFHLSYNMILNLTRVEGFSPEMMLEQCFYQFQNNTNLPQMEKSLARLEATKAKMTMENEGELAAYHDLREQLASLGKDIRAVITHPTHALPFLSYGRLVRVSFEEMDFGWGVVVAYTKRKAPKIQGIPVQLAPEASYIVDVLLYCTQDTVVGSGTFTQASTGARPCLRGEKGEFMVVPVLLSCLESLGTPRIHLPKDLRSLESRQGVYKTVLALQKEFPDGLPLIDPVEDMGIRDEAFQRVVRKIEALEKVLREHAFTKAPSVKTREAYDRYLKKMELVQRIKALRKRVTEATAVAQMDELKYRKRVLRRLGYTNSTSGVVEMKGRVACEISTGDELLLAELVFNGAFNEWTVSQTVGLLSCFCFQEELKDFEGVAGMKAALAEPLKVMQEAARMIVKVSKECKIELDEEAYVKKFRPELMEVAYAWANGAKFIQVCKMTVAFEGSIIRSFKLLEELLRQMAMAAKTMGNRELENKFLEGIVAIKRDIVFASSLYL